MHDLFEKIISYHDLINGNLAPNKINVTTITEYLNCEQLSCQDMIVGKFKKKMMSLNWLNNYGFLQLTH